MLSLVDILADWYLLTFWGFEKEILFKISYSADFNLAFNTTPDLSLPPISSLNPSIAVINTLTYHFDQLYNDLILTQLQTSISINPNSGYLMNPPDSKTTSSL